MRQGRHRIQFWAGFVGSWLIANVGWAAINENQVLLVINTNSPDSVTIGSGYTNVHPAVRVMNLSVPDAFGISRINYDAQIRDPIRTFLRTNNLASTVIALVTTKGLPYRVDLVGTDLG